MRYLQDIAKVVAKEGVPIHWVTPVGFPVYQYYPEMKSRRVETHLMGQVIQSTIREAKPETDKMKQRNSCPANYVHSLDSACMIRTVNIARAKGIENFCNVHDSFATHACDIDKLNESIREAFVSIFSKDLLSDFKAKVSETLSDEAIAELPDRPENGELDLDLLHKCKYFFA